MSNENPFLKGPRVQGGKPFLNGPRIPRSSPLVALGSPEYQARAQNLTRSRSHDAVTRVGDSIDPRVDYSQIPTDPRGMYGSVMGAKSGDIARTHDEFASDNRASLKQSALNVVGALPSMAAGLLSVPANYVNGLMQAQYAAQGTADGWLLPTVSAEQIESAIGLPGFGKAMSEGVRASQAGQSDKLAAQRAEFDATDGAISAAHYLLSNPSFGLSLALEQAGQFATLATPGGATAKVLGGAALAGGMNANEVQQDLAGRVQRGEITAAEASRRASNAFGLSAAANTLIPKALGSNAMTLERIASGAARSAAASAGSTAVLRGAGRGFLGEGLQGGLSEVADGAVKNHYTDKPLLADAGKNFVLGFGLEAMPGAAGGAVETLQAGPPESAKPSDTLRSELLTLGEELAGRDVVREETRHVPSMPQRVQKDPGIVPEDASDIDALLMRNLPQRGKAKLVANPMPQGLGEQLAAGTVFDSAPPVLDATRIGDALAGVDFAQQAPKLDATLLGELLAGDVLSRQRENNPEAPVAAGSLFSGEVKTEASQGVQSEVSVKHSEVGQSDDRPVTMQNRDRSRAASVAQMQSIRSYPDPERLGFSRDPNAGAPMVGEGAQVAEADKGATDVVVMASGRRVPVRYAVVEADAVAASHNADGHVNPDYDGAPLKALNNGRTAGLQAAWGAGNADAYREGIIADARLHGVSPKAIAGKKRPMLVRLYDPAANTGDMGAESNASAQLGLSPVEQAQTDSRTLPDMTGIQFAEDGSISPASNAAFFRAWFHNIGATQAATLQDAQGRPNAQALQRLKGALVYQAYGDERLLTALAEDVSPERRNVLNAMAQAAPAFAALEQDNTLAQEAKVALTGALELLRQAGERGLSVQEMVAQGDMLGRNAAAETVALFMAENARSAKRMAEAFRAIAEHADNAQMAAATHDIFGNAPTPTLRDSLEYANDRLAQSQDENTRPARFDTSRVKWPDVRADTASGSGQSQQAGRGRSAAENAGDAAAPARLDGGQGQQVSDGLFGAPSARDHVDAARRAKDAERDGRTGTGRTDMMAGDGELFAGPRPEQVDIEDAVKAQSEPNWSNRNGSSNRDETGIPAGLPAVSTVASERLARALHAHLRRRGYSGKPPRFLEVLSTSLPHELHAGLQTLGRITGTRVVIFRNLTPEIDDFNGVNFRDGTVYINENNEYPVTLTAAHEWVHNLKETHPELYQQLENEVRRQGRIGAWHERNIREEGMDRGRDHAIEELTAAAVSDALTDPEFLQRLAERNRGLFRRVAEAFLDFLNTLIRGWRDQGSNQYLQDVEAFRDKLAAVLEALPENGAASGATDVDALFQRVWHGTPHRGIEKTGFKLNAIGTGEGAQAYGWGIYFAGQRAVAEHYRKGLSYREQVRQFMRELPEDAGIDEVMEALERGDLPQATADVVRALADEDWLGFDYPAQAITAAFKELDNFDPSPELREAIRRYSGQLYQAEIPEDSGLLDWDAPLSKQPEKVKTLLRPLLARFFGDGNEGYVLNDGEGAPQSGKELYMELGGFGPQAQRASELLSEYGIPGLRYLDGDSRAAGEGSHNYVIWDEALLTPEAAQIEAMFSRKAQTKAAYEARIDALFAGAKGNRQGVRILDRADMLDLLGHGDKPLHLVESAVGKKDSAGRVKHPGMTAEMWKRLPEWIENPVAAFESDTVDGRITLVAPDLVDGKPVLVVLEPNGSMAGMDVHVAVNAYEKDNAAGVPTARWVRNGKLLYLDQKRSPTFSERSGLQLPRDVRQLRGYKHRVQTEADLHKYRAERDEAMFSRKSTVALTPEQEAFMAKAGLAADMRSTWQKARDWVAERVPDMTRMKERAAQWGLDRYYGLKDAVNKTGNIDLENDPYVAARMLNIASTMEAVLRFGAPRLKDGVLEIDRSIPGLLDALAPVKDNLNGFLGWMVARRAQLLKSQGRENLMSDADIAAGLSLRDGNEAAFDQAARDYLRLKNAILDLAEQTGTVNPQMRAMWDHAEYIPFYREGDYGAGTKKGLENQTAGIKQLKGGEAALRDPLANIMQNFTRLIDSGMKNRAMLLAVDQLGDAYFTKLSPSVGKVLVPANEVRQHLLNNGVSQAAIDAMPRAALNGMARMLAMTAPTGDNMVRVMRDGKPEYYEVADPLVLRSITAMEELQMHGVIKVMGWFKRVLTAGATMDPSFLARNLMRDTGEAAATARERFIPMYDTLRGAAESLRESELAQDLMMAGSYFRDGIFHQGDFDATQRATRRALQKHGVPESMIDKVVHTLINPKRVWDMYRALTESTEMGSRISLARNRLNAGGSKLEAAFEGKDFLDFGLHGDGVLLQWAIRTLPFLNARLQGNYRLFRMATGKERRKMVAARLASIALFTAVLYFWNMTEYEEEWENLNDWDKDMYWHIKPGTRFHTRIPKPFEIGLFAGTAVERSLAALMYQVSDGKRGDHSKQTLKAAGRGASDTLALNPVPQMARPMVEQFFNYNIFMGRNIESAFEQHKVPSERKTPRSSETAILLSKDMAGDDGDGGISPKRIEHLVRGYFGSMGMYVLRTADALVRAATDAPERPAMRLRDMPAIGALYRGDGMDANTRWTGDFYELRDQARKQSDRVKTLLAEGDHEAAARIERKYAWLLGRRERSTRAKAGFMHAGVRELNRQGTKLADMRKREAEIYASRTMNGDEKNAELEQLYRERNKLTRAATQSARMREREQMRQ
ncbi:hypothetical protein CO615_04010 [Lysobacteraceae bacterium NML75-0749]|nr:hypothetical protein CO615_04010 [Xanthomonadaceae bacterium NML75-0749]